MSSLRDFVSCASIRCHVSVPMISLLASLILTRLDYCTSVLFGLPDVLVFRLQSFQNAAARMVFNLRRTANVANALICLHCLQVPERIRFKFIVYWYISLVARVIAALPSNLHPDVGDHGTLQLALGVTSPTGRSSLPSLQLGLGRPRFSGFGRHCVERTSNGKHLSTSSLSIFRSRLTTFLFYHSFPGAVV
jgi:hypothetical protein